MINNELVTICIPAYNAEKFIKQTINSLLNQTYTNIRIIVCDNASTDGTRIVVESIEDERVEYRYFDEFLDVNYSMVRSLKQGETELICMFHADDWYYPTIIEDYCKYMNSIKDVGAIFSKCKYCLEEELEFIEFEQECIFEVYNYTEFVKKAMKEGTVLHAPTMMVRKSILYESNLFHKDIEYISDIGIWLQIVKVTKIIDVQKIYCNHRKGSVISRKADFLTSISPQFIIMDNELEHLSEALIKEIGMSSLRIYEKRRSKHLLKVIINRWRRRKPIKEYVMCFLFRKKLTVEGLAGNIDNYKNQFYGRE